MSTTEGEKVAEKQSTNAPPPPPSSTSRPEEWKVTKGRKPTSSVWEHFSKLPCENKDDLRASCNYCGQDLACPTKSGTSALHNHLKRCKKYPNNDVDKKQKLLVFQSQPKDGGDNSTSVTTWRFEQECCRKALARMIILSELAFRLVEHEGFRDFYREMQPRFVIPSRATLTKDCFRLYVDEKKNLKQFFKRGSQRISLTTDTWSSRQNLSYMCLTVHFIDDNWTLHKRILSFCPVSSHSCEAIGKAVERCLLDWGIDKVLTITVDNASSNDVGVQHLRRRLNSWGGSVLNGDHLHVRCCAHILSLVVKEGLKDLSDSIYRIHSVVRYVRSSPARLQRFKSCVEQEKIESDSLVCLDGETRWNFTYLMLEAALKFQKAFECLEEQDSKYNDELLSTKNRGLPTKGDWDHARVLLPFLKTFYEATLRVSGSLYVTSNIYFHEVFSVSMIISEWCKSTDSQLQSMACKMRTKFDKYWGSVKNVNMLLFVSMVLDPRQKLDYVIWVINESYDEMIATQLCDKVKEILKSLFDFYSSSVRSSSEQQSSMSSQTSSEKKVDEQSKCDPAYIISKYKRKKAEEQGLEIKSELDKYLSDDSESEEEGFDILCWWKVNSSKYRILALIARDVLAVPVSTVASESAFSTRGRVLDPFRSSLTPKIVESLICAQNWLRSSPVPIDVEERIEELEKLEQDMYGLGMEPSHITDDC